MIIWTTAIINRSCLGVMKEAKWRSLRSKKKSIVSKTPYNEISAYAGKIIAGGSVISMNGGFVWSTYILWIWNKRKACQANNRWPPFYTNWNSLLKNDKKFLFTWWGKVCIRVACKPQFCVTIRCNIMSKKGMARYLLIYYYKGFQCIRHLR